MLKDQPRAIRNEKDELRRLKAVSDIRCRPWVGDKMLLMQANNTTHEKVKNHFEERARQEAKRAIKAGGQVLLDFEEQRGKMDTSSKFASKMWADYRRHKEDYLRDLRNGLISLKTGESIKGDPSMYQYSALNPANGHVQSTGNGSRFGTGVAKLAEGRDDLLRHDMGNIPDTFDRYSSIAQPFQHPTRNKELFRSFNDQAETTANKSLEQTRDSIDNINSETNFHNNSFGGERASDGYSSKSPEVYNDLLDAPLTQTNVSDETFNIHTTSYGGKSRPAFNQKLTGDVTQPNNTKSMGTGSQSGNLVEKSINIGLGENGWNYRQKEESIAYEGKSAEPHGSQAGGFEQVENSSQMAFAVSSKKRKDSMLEEEMMEGRLLKKQCQLERRLQPEQEPENEQLQPRIQHNRLDFEVDTGERHVQEPNHPIEEFFEWNRHVMQDTAAFPVQPQIQGTSNRGELDVSNNVSYPESSFRNESISKSENHPIKEANDVPGNTVENAIFIPDGKDDAEAARESESIGNQTNFNRKLPAEEEDEPGYLPGASCVKGYTNVWYYQGRLRT